MPTVHEGEEAAIDRILFVSIHFASDHDTSVDEPVVSGGRLLYGKPMSAKTAAKSYGYYMCKYWFFLWYNRPHETLEGWRQGGQSGFTENLKGSEMFAVPLYDITSSQELEKLVIEPLHAVEQQA